MHRYKNETEHELVIIGLGVVGAGETFETPRLIANPNLTILSTPDDKPELPPAPAQPQIAANSEKETN
jgi:hypothetical protein